MKELAGGIVAAAAKPGIGVAVDIRDVFLDIDMSIPCNFGSRLVTSASFGMSLVHSLVEQIGGSMSIRGGGGAEFDISIPARKPA